MFSGTATVRIGIRGDDSQRFLGAVRRVIVRNGIGGTTVLDVNAATDITSGAATTFTATSGQTVTVNRATSGRKTVLVTRPVVLFGTDDYCEVADSPLLDPAAGDPFTVSVVARKWGTTANQTLVAHKADTTTGAGFVLDTGTGGTAPRLIVADGTNSTTATGTLSAGTLSMITGVRDVGADQIAVSVSGTSGTPQTDTTTGSLASADTLRIGRLSGAGTAYADMELFAVMVWRRPLTLGERYDVARYYGAVA